MYRRESVVSDVTHTADELPSVVAKLRPGLWPSDEPYPFSRVLRLRVLQIVCGISVVVMGSVACIEDRACLTRLGLGVPAGFFTVMAAGVSIHVSRGFGGYRPASASCPAALRCLGPRPAVAAPLTLLWVVACSLHLALIVQAFSVLRHTDYSRSTRTSFLLALVEALLSALTLAAECWVRLVDVRLDPD